MTDTKKEDSKLFALMRRATEHGFFCEYGIASFGQHPDIKFRVIIYGDDKQQTTESFDTYDAAWDCLADLAVGIILLAINDDVGESQ